MGLAARGRCCLRDCASDRSSRRCSGKAPGGSRRDGEAPGGMGTWARGSLGGWMSSPVPWCWCQTCAWAGWGTQGGCFSPGTAPRGCFLRACWQSWRGGGLALAACRLSRARHPPRPPTPLLLGLWLRLGASGEVLCSTPRSAAGSSACAWEPLRGKGPAGTAWCWRRHPTRMELCAQMWTPCTPSGVPQHSPPPSPMPGCGAPFGSIPLPSGTATRCHRAQIVPAAVVPATPGAGPPRAPRQRPFCRGRSKAARGWGGRAGTRPPEYQSGGGG